jgi:hypothetical protein
MYINDPWIRKLQQFPLNEHIQKHWEYSFLYRIHGLPLGGLLIKDQEILGLCYHRDKVEIVLSIQKAQNILKIHYNPQVFRVKIEMEVLGSMKGKK